MWLNSLWMDSHTLSSSHALFYNSKSLHFMAIKGCVNGNGMTLTSEEEKNFLFLSLCLFLVY